MRTITNIKWVLSGALCFLLLIPLLSHADTANPLTGNYYGTATIQTPSPLGTIDLAFYLDAALNGTIQNSTSYISLDKTLLFPAVAPQIGGKDVGPRVSGTVTPSSFTLTTATFSSTSTAIGKTVSRSISLTGTTVTNGGNSIKGTFTETITNLGQNPITVAGTFILVKPIVMQTAGIVDTNSDGCIDLSELRAGGKDPNTIEFEDLSIAYHLYNNPTILPNLCEPKNQVIQNALQGYYSTLQ
jgi:hypothetical protein